MHRQLVFTLLATLGTGCVAMTRTLPTKTATTTAPAPAVAAAPAPAVAAAPAPATTSLWQFEQFPRQTADAAADPTPTPAAPASAQPDLTVLTTPPIRAVKSSGYGWRDDPFRRRRKFHSGADYASKSGTPVAAAGSGVVLFAGRRSGYGNTVLVDHGGGIATLYGHLRRIEVQTNAKISAGDRIGQVGRTGRATGPHLHFEVRVDGRPVDPVMAMALAQTERGPSDDEVAALTQTADALSEARAEQRGHARSKRTKQLRRERSERSKALW